LSQGGFVCTPTAADGEAVEAEGVGTIVRSIDELKARLIDVWCARRQPLVDETIPQWLRLPYVRYSSQDMSSIRRDPVRAVFLNIFAEIYHEETRNTLDCDQSNYFSRIWSNSK